MEIKMNPKVSLRLRYKKAIQFAFALSLLICIIGFQAFKKINYKEVNTTVILDKIEVEDVPRTHPEKLPEPPPRPTIPIESESEDIPPSVTIEDNILDLDKLPERPLPPPVEDEHPFVPYDSLPKPIGGFRAIQENLVYPEFERKAGLEGKVIVEARISDKGEVIDTKILVRHGNTGFNDAAVAAIKAVKWKPAKQRDKPVTVWISIPVIFRLN